MEYNETMNDSEWYKKLIERAAGKSIWHII